MAARTTLRRTRFLHLGMTGPVIQSSMRISGLSPVVWDDCEEQFLLGDVAFAWLRYGKLLLPNRRPRRLAPEVWQQIKQWVNDHTRATPLSARP